MNIRKYGSPHAAYVLMCGIVFAAGCGGGSFATNKANALITGVTIPAATTVTVGSAARLTATVLPSNASATALSWQSSNSGVASVSDAGVVTGLGPGSALITAAATDGSNVVSNPTSVTVVQLVTRITLTTTATIYTGASATFTAAVLPSNASNPVLTWSSSDTAVATVNASGVVTSISPGSTQITAASTDGSNITSNATTVTVTVPPTLVTQISLPTAAFVDAGSTTALAATVLPGSATNPTLSWHSSNTAVATVSSTGVVTGVATGATQITATSTDGSQISSNICTLTSRASSSANAMGINFGPALDYTANRIFTDVMKTSRAWTAVGSWTSVITALDANGWPMQDASIVVWQGIDNMQGAYALSFSGLATLNAGAWGSISNQTYNAATNQTTATLAFTSNDATAGLLLTFTNTQRTASSATNSGITDIVLMRPTVAGGSTTYTNQTFTTPFLSALSGFTVLRAMDYSATNSNTSVNWSDRTLPGNASQQIGNPAAPASTSWESRGGAWEYAILLANQTGEDLWINIPEHATDDYVTKLAQMIQYGSDGVNPYTSAQSSPVWPALTPGLRVYVEYSNELWNFANGFQQSKDNHTDAVAEVAAGGSPLNFDGTTNDYFWAWRRTAERTVEISNDFREVVGDASMMTRVRPVLMSQLGYASGPLYQAMHLLVDFYDNGSEVATPHPPSYYIYGLGGSAYYSATDLSSVANILSTMGDAPTGGLSYATEVQEDADWSLAFGVHRIAYEGGPSMPATGDTSKDANQANAWADPGMEQVVVNEHNAWSQNAGELLVYYEIAGNYEWGFTSDVMTPSSEKMAAITALKSTPRVQSTYGTPIPGTLSASNPAVPPSWTSSNLATMSSQSWMGFSVLVSTVDSYNVILSAGATTAGAQLEIFVDGNSIGTATVANTGSLTVYTNSLALTTPSLSIGSHGIVVRSVSGTAQLNQVIVQPAS